MSTVPDIESTATKQRKVKASEKKVRGSSSPSTPVQLPTQGAVTRTACIWDRPTPMVVNLPMKVEGEHQLYLQCQPGVNPAVTATLVVGSSPGQTGFALKVENGNSSGSSGPDSSAMMVDENSPSSSTASNGEHSATNGSSGAGGDMEGVWSQDIDQAFQEALAIYPACGRRKIILSEEGKMYGRNELIARYIKIRCGKTRTRKQVSSHIQVLARKKQRETRARMQESTEENGFDPGCGGTAVSNGGAKTVAMTSSSSSLQAPATINSVRSSLPAVGAALSPPGFNATAAAGLLNVIDMGTSAGCTGESKTNGGVVAGGGGMWPYASSGGVSGGMAALGAYYNAPSMRKTIRDDPQFYQQFAAAALAGVSFAANPSLTSTTSTSSSLQSAIIPSATFPLGYSSAGKPPPEEGAFMPDTCGFTMASSKLVLCDFIAYVEQHGVAAASGSDNGRVDLVRIPKVFDDPMETIRLEAVQQKYPDTLQELFKTGPLDAFFLAKCWANMAFDPTLDNKTINYAVDSLYESSHNFDINVATKVCSFGSQVVEKVEVYSPVKQTVKNEDGGANSNGEPLYRFTVEKSPMCDYMTRFITELRKLEAPQVMDSVLENFTVLQIITDKATEETLMVIAFIFQVSPDPESSCRIYRLVK